MGSNGKLMKFYWNTFFCGIEWELVGIEWNFDGIWCDFMESCLDFTELYWNFIYIIGFERFCWESNGIHSDMSMGSEDDQHQLWVSPRTGGYSTAKSWPCGFWGYMGVPRSWICLKDTKNVKIPQLYWLSPWENAKFIIDSENPGLKGMTRPYRCLDTSKVWVF